MEKYIWGFHDSFRFDLIKCAILFQRNNFKQDYHLKPNLLLDPYYIYCRPNLVKTDPVSDSFHSIKNHEESMEKILLKV